MTHKSHRVLATLASLGAILITQQSAFAEEPPAVPADHAVQMAASMELFKSHVGPLLKEHCVACHGGKETHGEFDLTTRESLLKGGELGPAVVPGKPDESLLVKLVRHGGEPNMPQDAEKLSDEAIGQIAAWIAAGAAYDKPLVEAAEMTAKTVSPADRQFWSFKPLANAPAPVVVDSAWCRTDVDRFILAALKAKNLQPNSSAEKRTLIRRAYFDLIGLPPTPAEVEAFLADESPEAFNQLVDRLLDNPHYGERWARHWLDLARFAESHGYEQDYDRPTAYHYRDFLIKALNDDMPYDRFVRLQIAGDEFEPDNPQALMATGFLGAGTHATQITANQVEKERYDELDDMTATVGTALLGLTVGCARCHDHKFDPIPQADYYRMVSTFTTAVRSDVDLDLKPEVYREKKEAFDREHAPLAESLAAFERDQLPARFEAWLATDVKAVTPKWLVLDQMDVKSDQGAKFTKLDDGSLLLSEKNGDFDVYTIVVQTQARGITGVRLEALPHESLPKSGPGRAENGNFALSDFQLWSAPMGIPSPGAPVKLNNAHGTFQQKGLPVTATVDDRPKSAWAVDGEIGKPHAASFEIETPITNPQGTALTFVMRFENNKGHNLGRLRLALTTTAKPVKLGGDEATATRVAEVNAALATPAGERTEEQRATLLDWYRQHDPEWKKLHDAANEHLKQAPKPELTKVMVTTEGRPAIRFHTQGGDFLEQTFFLKRGDLNQKIAPASQSFLQVLMNAPDREQHWQEKAPEGSKTSYRRRAMANWLTDAHDGAGHLLARVMVNRLWQHHFGRGLVATASDFGASGSRPTHPELLDFLAAQLIANDWHLKPIHKLILSSAAYQQSTASDAARSAIDPENLLLWRQSRQRLEAEVIRDAMLSVSGLLDEKLFGPGTLDEGHVRRSIYFTIKRSQLVPSMMLYDAPDSLQGLGQRASTIVAPQALAMLNSKQVQASAKAFAQKLQAAANQTAAEPAANSLLVGKAYEAALGRPADAVEMADSLAFLQKSTDLYQKSGKSNASDLALADFCQVLLGLNEFIYID